MTTSALILMITVQVTVTAVTAYFFIKVLRTPENTEPDSSQENE